jgi:hypothetical protein
LIYAFALLGYPVERASGRTVLGASLKSTMASVRFQVRNYFTCRRDDLREAGI